MTEASDKYDGIGGILVFALELKASMLKHNRRAGWRRCPRCGGKVKAVLAGHKNHIHMACETPNCMRCME